MVMSVVWAVLLGGSIICALVTGRGQMLSAGVMQGAQSGVTLAISIAGSLCLWAGVGRLMEKIGFTAALARLLRPVTGRLFPSTREDPKLAQALSANICANVLGLGNAATPPGIEAAQRMAKGCGGRASDELCRLIVLNTASIQLIPANVAAVRSALGCGRPFDILPAVWLASLCSAGMGLLMAWLLGRISHD
ncbi:MAG: spore maturation protein A [Candidatus Faecousia sp.]|nr:spore maturation protein A [Bacillota bacterium]MDY4754924.1 spore maturation protein A [Candidatus Faecousia sp.]MDY6159426.1 spore maturation protein A [Candidatus Faecousia sp.]